MVCDSEQLSICIELSTLLEVSLCHFSCPPYLEYLCPRVLILLRLRRYINLVLTYLNDSTRERFRE